MSKRAASRPLRTFSSILACQSSVAALKAFYRAEMKQRGWQENHSVIDKPTVVLLDFSKDSDRLTITVTQMSDHVNVAADGAVLGGAKPKPPVVVEKVPEIAEAPVRPAPASDIPIPVPESATELKYSAGFATLDFTSPAGAKTTGDFYRAGMTALGWQEEAAGINSDVIVQLKYSKGGKDISISITQRGTVDLAAKNADAAAKADMLPKPGRAKVLLGNALPADAVITIDKQTIKVAAGTGRNGPGGPSLDLAPGKYAYSLKIAACLP